MMKGLVDLPLIHTFLLRVSMNEHKNLRNAFDKLFIIALVEICVYVLFIEKNNNPVFKPNRPTSDGYHIYLKSYYKMRRDY